MSPHLTRQDVSHLATLIVIGMIVQLAVITYVAYTAWDNRNDLVFSQRAGCDRAKLDRNANASGWRSAAEARRASGDYAIAEQYSALAARLEARGRINCAVAFPKVSFLP